ncbi:MAG TPA: HD domain-containing phosphohydrolase [Caldimonas sp.]|nr:HD domain-containing phosphohydrolase [Caldimonas sp.]HEX4233354.1 HD domain-containing phosphohydrolase [Caldimonas sp.]
MRTTQPIAVAGLSAKTVALACALGQRDGNTGAHSERTSALALELGRAAALSSATLATLGLAAQLHDVGKIGIPDAVLLKTGRLEPAELEIMRTHPQRGYEILSAVPDEGISAVAEPVLHHHEHFAGSGYPGRLKGEEIPLLSRIIAIADSYDAMATDRPYHRAKAHSEIMRILFDVNGDKYDPHLVGKFAALIESSRHRSRGPLPIA